MLYTFKSRKLRDTESSPNFITVLETNVFHCIHTHLISVLTSTLQSSNPFGTPAVRRMKVEYTNFADLAPNLENFVKFGPLVHREIIGLQGIR